MAVVANTYNHARHVLGQGGVNLEGATIRVALLSSLYVPNYNMHGFFGDVAASEIPAMYGYGRLALPNKTWTKDAAANRSRLSSSAVTWTAAGGNLTPRYAVVYVDTGAPTTSILLSCVLLDDTNGGRDILLADGQIMTLAPPPTGWFEI